MNDFFEKAAEKTAFVREKYDISSIPTDVDNVSVLPFFGDLRHLFVLSSLLLNRFRKDDKGSKYFIVCSYPGFAGFFPYTNEYWGIKDKSLAKKLYAESCQLTNKSSLAGDFYRSINKYFFNDVILEKELIDLYQYGLTDVFWEKYKHIKKFLPFVPSYVTLGKDFVRDLSNKPGFKVLVYPSLYIQTLKMGQVSQVLTKKEFWLALVECLEKNGFTPIIHRNYLTHDLSPNLAEKSRFYVYTTEEDISKVMAAMRSVGCVLDVFSGISRIAIAARTPFLAVDERARYNKFREYEIDDICAKNLPRQYIFSFPTIIEGGNNDIWEFNLFANIVAKLNSFFVTLDRETWPPTGESEEIVSYDSVRKLKLKKFGLRYIRLPKG